MRERDLHAITNFMNKKKQLSWKPVLKGKIYCSPACGAGCTKADYKTAHRLGVQTIARLKTGGWEVEVHENIGWHWCLVNTRCGMSVHYNARTKTFYTMMVTGNVTKQKSGSAHLPISIDCKDPNKAVEWMYQCAEAYYAKHQRAIDGLHSIKGKR